MSQFNFPEILINGQSLDSSNIARNLAYFDEKEDKEAIQQATLNAVLTELLRQRANTLGLDNGELDPNEQMMEQLLDDLIDKDVPLPSADEEEMAFYYKNNKSKFVTSPLVEARHILLMSDPNDLEHRADTRKQAEVLLESLKNNTGEFSKIASEISDCPSGKTKGSLGQMSRGQTVEEYDAVLFTEKEGLIDFVIETRFGFHLTIIDRRIEGKQQPYELVKEKIRDFLDQKVYHRAISQYLQVLVKEADIQGYTVPITDTFQPTEGIGCQ